MDNTYHAVFEMKVASLSVNVLELEQFETESECRAKHGKWCSVYQEALLVARGDKFTMENDAVKIGFDQRSYMVNSIVDKVHHIHIGVDMTFIRYKGQGSESGAYIFAPNTEGV